MEQKQISCGSACDRLPPLSANYPWLVVQNLEGTGDHTFYTIHNHLCHYRCQSPELLGRRIQGYFHGWVILSHKTMWSLWNPVTGKIIHLPPLTLKDGNSEFSGQCCLSSPPNDPSSILLLMRTAKPSFVFCRLNCEIKLLRWTELSYARELKRITSYDGVLRCPTLYNGKVYALYSGHGHHVIQLDIVIKDGEVAIKPLSLGYSPHGAMYHCRGMIKFLKGSSTELFCINVCFRERTNNTFGNVFLFKWSMNSMRWEEMEDLKNAILFVDLAHDYSVFYSHSIASELGGYIHIRDEKGKMMYSYNVEDKTISLSSMPSLVLPTSHVSLWEHRSEGDHGEATCTVHSKHEEDNDNKIVERSVKEDGVELTESPLLNIPFPILEIIMELCVGVEYMYFRATCKRCHLLAPSIHWSNKAAVKRLHNYSVVSPWLMVLEENRSIITFTDPMFGEKYFMKKVRVVSPSFERIHCSRFGWILFHSRVSKCLMFFNPFTKNMRKVPDVGPNLYTACFSAPPTSPDCMVVGFTKGDSNAYIYSKKCWRKIYVDLGGACPYSYCFPTFHGRDLYALTDEGQLYVFKNLVKLQDYHWKEVAVTRGRGGQNFLVKCQQHLLLVIVGKFGEFVEVFKQNVLSKDWEQIHSLERHMIYICGTQCLCLDAKTPKMGNKIYFPRLHSKNGKIVFYSLETGRYHTFNGKNLEETFGIGIGYVRPHIWIEPSWS